MNILEIFKEVLQDIPKSKIRLQSKKKPERENESHCFRNNIYQEREN